MMSSSTIAAAIERVAQDQFGNAFRIESVQRIRGNTVRQAQCITGTGRRLFVKLRPAEDRDKFAAEIDGLAALAKSANFRVPAVFGQCEAEGLCALVLEWLDLAPLHHPGDAAKAGETLATMHEPPQAHFGWRRDNYIGDTPQANTQTDNWSRFFVEHRLQPQLALAAANGFTGDLQRKGERLCERVPGLFLDYLPPPSLLHGDLWPGNIGVLPDGALAIFDPACYCGDRETELAMTELFGGFPSAFYASYREKLPLHEDYERRKPLYNLYHVLNHLNLFGRGYLGQAERMIAQLTR